MFNLNKARLPVRIVFASTRQGGARFSRKIREEMIIGADFLRVQEIKGLISPHLPENIDLSFTTYSNGGRWWNFDTWLMLQRPAVFILSKDIGYSLTKEKVERLKQKAIAVGMDHKDGDLSKIDLSPFDFHISTSQAGLDVLNRLIAEDPALRARGVFAELLYQSHDLRLDALPFSDLGRFAPVYLGLPQNAEIPASIMDEITTYTVLYNKDMLEVMPKLVDYNFHFGVRPDPGRNPLRMYKPFTKGLNAAACRSNILVNRQVDDALHLLGEDYPYLVASNGQADVEEGYRRAREDFGGPDWARGLEHLRAASERVAAPAVTEQFVRIVTQAASGAHPRLRAG